MTSQSNVVFVDSSGDDRWDEYVRRQAKCSLYHRYAWRSVIERSFGHKTHYLLSVGPNGKCDGILPLVHLRSWAFGNFFVSLPFFNYGGVCADDRSVLDRLFAAAANLARQSGATHIEARASQRLDLDLPVKTSKVTMRLELPSAPDSLWQMFPSKLRSQIKRPLKEGMAGKVGGIEELDAFYHVFSMNMRDLGTPVYSKGFFRNILTTFSDCARICTVYDCEQRPVSSGFLLGFKDTLEIPWASSLRAHQNHSPNMLMYWTVLQHACASGFRVFDFGRSSPGEGTYKFKAQWGAQPTQLYWYYWLAEKQSIPDLSPKNPKYSLAIKVWQRLPVALTRTLGPRIVRNLP